MPEVTLPDRASFLLPFPFPAPADSDAADVEQFVAAHGLGGHLEAALRIAEQAFPKSELRVRLQRSPELDAGRLVIQIRTRGSMEDALRCHQVLLDRWTRELPLHAQDHITATFTLA